MYASPEDFTNTFLLDEMVQLTNLYDPTATEINLERLTSNQQKAHDLINGTIAKCPDISILMPFSAPYPGILIGLELDITRYFLDSVKARPDVKERYDAAMKNLEKLGACKLGLGIVNNQPPTDSSDLPDYSSPTRIFTQDSLGAYY